MNNMLVNIKLVSHINSDGDLLPAWFEYYSKLGITSFHIIVHGPREENNVLYELINSYPIFIEDEYEGEFSVKEKQKRLNSLLSDLKGDWILLVDSDEFVEFPYINISKTIQKLECLGSNALYAPIIQRITNAGSLESSEHILDPFGYFPKCSIDLCKIMGVKVSRNKYPLFYCNESTNVDGGNHYPPNSMSTLFSDIQGVTHHFKWRKTVLSRINKRANSSHPYRHKSAGILEYLTNHNFRLPTKHSFHYSRRQLFRRGLLRKENGRNQNAYHENFKKNNWWKDVFLAIQEITSLISSEEKFILIDEDQFALELFVDCKYIPFIKGCDAGYWGSPLDDNTVILCLENFRQKGAKFLVIGFPAFWWLDYYSGFNHYLRTKFSCLMENNRVKIFDIGALSY